LGDRLFAMAPIRHIDLIHAGGSIAPLLSAPQLQTGLARLDSLSLRGIGLDDDGAEKLADCAALARCAWVDLRDNHIGYRGALSLAHSPHFRRKHAVILHGNPVDPADQGIHPHALR